MIGRFHYKSYYIDIHILFSMYNMMPCIDMLKHFTLFQRIEGSIGTMRIFFTTCNLMCVTFQLHD